MDNNKIVGLQAARAFAAVTVMYFHSYVAVRAYPEDVLHALPLITEYGFLGVNFFFGISGFVIATVISRPNFTLSSFINKRIFRLYPIYFMALLAAWAFSAGGWGVADFLSDQNTFSYVLRSLLFIPMDKQPMYAVTWSLEHEIIFYAVAGIIAFLFPLKLRVPVLAIFMLAVAYSKVKFGINLWDFHFFSLVNADFLAGVVCYMFRNQVKHLGILLPAVLSMVFFFLLLSEGVPFMGSFAIFFLLCAFLNLKTVPTVINHLGDASYSIYMTHWFLIYVGVYLSVKLDTSSYMHPELWRLIVLSFICLFSYMTFKVIEEPCIKFGNKVYRKYIVPKISKSKIPCNKKETQQV